ncbi:hypothetical protein ACGF5O_19110 [Streptomyces sp. NPDC048291]|uniref:hypothetical protein n=1 Tax=Streptomyces sp. NPDC048291 TaxID=3365530 RepID=UPI00370F825A
MRLFARLIAVRVRVVALVAEKGFWVTSLTFAAVVMTLSGVPRPSQVRWCRLQHVCPEPNPMAGLIVDTGFSDREDHP